MQKFDRTLPQRQPNHNERSRADLASSKLAKGRLVIKRDSLPARARQTREAQEA